MTAVSASELDALARREHANPHAVLGAHPSPSGVTVRALRPEAGAIAVIPDRGTRVALGRIHPAGIFEGELPGAVLPLSYELEVDYPNGTTIRLRDPYAFEPTLGELDLHLIGEGRHERLYERLGAHVRELGGAPAVAGTAFAVWAPAARSVSVVGGFNLWDGRVHQMRSLGSSGIWELFVPGVGDGALYKYEILNATGKLTLKADPYALEAELPPQTASVVHTPRHAWSDGDAAFLRARRDRQPLNEPVSIYEVHLGSWRLNPLEGNRSLSYRELGRELAAYVTEMGFTHVELLPVMAHPFAGSWGYQVTGYYAPDPRHGAPDDLRAMVDELHAAGIGVILDWVPAHFPRDEFALIRFDGTALYEHADPRRGEHPDWGTLEFNFGRWEVRNFLIANALFWLREYHADGLRVDAVASMLYLDYSRDEGEWVPNRFGGREDLEAVAFLRELNEVIYAREPGIVSAAEESTAWPGVSRPTYLGGLGFGLKWNMGWMHDTLGYFAHDPIHRRHHHHELTFSMIYAYSENFVLPLSHDEAVHGKGSLYAKMAGADPWQKLANLRALYGYMWAHPGKKLLFMGSELAQRDEWSHDGSVHWHLRDEPAHAGVQALVRDLNRIYRSEPALYELDCDPDGFWWLEPNDADSNVIAFVRASGEHAGAKASPADTDAGATQSDATGPATVRRLLVLAANLSPVPREGYRIGLPRGGRWREVLNTDSQVYGGSGVGNHRGVQAESVAWHDQPFSAPVTLPPLAAIWLVPDG